jgi:pyrimidine operon attenuation protein/uracil phosphoribosyltransferase
MNTPMTADRRFRLYDRAATESLLDDMARALAPRIAEPASTVLIGIRRRGAPLADALGARLATHHGVARLRRLDLKIKRYSDDLHLLHPDTQLTEEGPDVAAAVHGRHVVLVDDVLYQGHSLLRAVRWLVDAGARSIHTALLVDRGIASLPIHADVVGATLRIPDDAVVECNVPPFEAELAIDLWFPPQGSPT